MGATHHPGFVIVIRPAYSDGLHPSYGFLRNPLREYPGHKRARVRVEINRRLPGKKN